MTQEEFIVELFVRVDERLHSCPCSDRFEGQLPLVKDPRAKLHPSELVTIGILFVLKATSQRRFYQWLSSNHKELFPHLPERTRLFRLLAQYQAWADRFLAEPTLLNYSDSLGMETVHPRREGRSEQQVGRKGKSNGRWVVGIKFCVLLNSRGQIVDWDAESGELYDGDFQRLLRQWQEEAICLADKGFHLADKRGGDCANLLICERGQRNYRMIVETVFSSWTRLMGMKKIGERVWKSMEAKLSFACAAWNLLTQWATERGGGQYVSLSMAWIPI